MPQRFLRPGITTSKPWNNLDWITQSFYIRLITLVDDSGRFEADPLLLKSLAFPLNENIKSSQVAVMCEQLSAQGLTLFYAKEGKNFLQMTKWKERVRSASRYPGYEDCEQMLSNDSKCLLTSSHKPLAISHESCDQSEQTKRGFEKPTALEVTEYAKSKGFTLDGEYFIDYQDARDWRLKGGQKIKDWQAVVRTWKKNDKSFGGSDKKEIRRSRQEVEGNL